MRNRVFFLTSEKTLHRIIFPNRVNGSSHTNPEKSFKFLDLCAQLMLQNIKADENNQNFREVRKDLELILTRMVPF